MGSKVSAYAAAGRYGATSPKLARVFASEGGPVVPMVLVMGVMLIGAANVNAQIAPVAPQAPAKLLVEKIESGWLIAPDVRGTDLDGRAATLAGGYAGRITDRTLVFGAGGYWLVNRDDDFKMAYGGGVVEWLGRSDRKIGFGVRTLVGGGSATLPRALGDVVQIDAGRGGRNGRTARFGGRTLDPDARVAVRDDFFVVEPQVNLLWNLTRRHRISFGVGYRAVGAAALLGEQIRGASGSIAVQIGGGS
ncbi:MAG: hypothetical protein AB7P34_11350 [Vicinamibacterales bacterium]